MASSTTIYHYTTISGLIGIITNLELWASDCRFLNDGAEISYARDLYYSELAKLNLKPIQGAFPRVAGPSLELIHMFVACFCEDGDLLSQWRGYGADQGYAIGFDTTQLQALNIGEICPVQYGIENPSEYFADELSLAPERTAHPGTEEWHMSMGLLPRLARVKHPGFAEEREWRLLRPEPNMAGFVGQKKPIQFRPSPMGPIAYIALSFLPECLREIVIGPGSHSEIRDAAVRGMLRQQNISDVNVRISVIPFRR